MKKFHLFYTPYYECETVESFDSKEMLEAFLSSTDWDKDGAHVYGIVEGELLEMFSVERVKAYKVRPKQ